MHRYTTEQIEWLKDNSHKHTRRETTRLFNKRFGTELSAQAIKTKTLKSGFRFKQREDYYTPKQERWLKENASLFTRAELTTWFNAMFDENRTESAIKRKCVLSEYSASSDGRFIKGNPTWNTGMSKEEHKAHFTDESYERMIKQLDARTKHKIGDTVVKRVGGVDYPYVVVAEPSSRDFHKTHTAKSRYVWEQHYGKVPDDSVVITLDGNQMNCEIENLRCITNAQKMAMTSNEWWRLPKELKDVAVTWLKLDTQIRKEQKSKAD